MQCRRLADAAEADEARLAGLLQLLQRGRHLVQGDVDGELVAAVPGNQRIVQLEQVDMVAAHAAEAVVHALGDRLGHIGAVLGRQPHLGADHDVGLERLQHAAEIALGLAVAVERRRVEVVDAGLQSARHGALLIVRPALGHQPADSARTVAKHGNLKTRASQTSLLHRILPFFS